MAILGNIRETVRQSLRSLLEARLASIIEEEVEAQLEDLVIEEYIDVDELVSEALDNEGI